MPSSPSPRARVRRAPKRATTTARPSRPSSTRRSSATSASSREGQPYVIPTLHARVGDEVYVHGSAASRLVRALAAGAPACLTVTLLDGLVLARSAFHHSVNYRSVVLLGRARPVEGDEERLRALEAFTEQLVPGRWADVRPPSRQELRATRVLALHLDEVSAKVRSGPPVDDEADMELGVWAGVLPLRTQALAPEDDPRLAANLWPPGYVLAWPEICAESRS